MVHFKFTKDEEMAYSWVVLGTSYFLTRDASSSLMNGITAYGLLRLYNSYSQEDDINHCQLHNTHVMDELNIKKTRRFPHGDGY